MTVTVYSISNCPKCSAAKALLKRKEISFEEFNVQESSEKNQEMLEKLREKNILRGEASAPVLDIEGTLIEGYNKEKILAALKEKGLGK